MTIQTFIREFNNYMLFYSKSELKIKLEIS